MAGSKAFSIAPGGGRPSKSGPWNFKVLGDDTDNRMSSIETYFQPGILLAPPHIHRREDQIIMTLSGEITMEINDEIVVAPAGTSIYVPRDTRHTAWGSGPDTAVVIEVNAPAGFERYIMELDEMIATRTLTVPAMVERGVVYGCDYDLPRVQYLVQKYNLKLPGGM